MSAALAFAGCTQNQTQSPSGAPSGAPSAENTSQALDLNPAAGIVMGAGWYPLEHFGGETFQWARNDAEITACPDVNDRTLAMMLELGPGIGAKSTRLSIDGNHGDHSVTTLTGRQFVKVDIARGVRGETFVIHADTRNLPSPHGDKRILNYRLLQATLGPSSATCPKDIARDGTLAVGTGWYPYETYNDTTFRWVNNDAQIIVAKAQAKPFAIQVDVAPGPSLGKAPLILTLNGPNGAVATSGPVRAREVVSLQVPAQPSGAKLTLSTHSKNLPAPHERRTLNFQVFNLLIKP